jgi:hypothetical protein
MAQSPRIVKPGHCSACGLKFQPETGVVRTDSGATVCEEHDWMFVPGAIVFRGRYDESRRA